MTEDEMVGWHHQLNGHEFEQTLDKPTCHPDAGRLKAGGEGDDRG